MAESCRLVSRRGKSSRFYHACQVLGRCTDCGHELLARSDKLRWTCIPNAQEQYPQPASDSPDTGGNQSLR